MSCPLLSDSELRGEEEGKDVRLVRDRGPEVPHGLTPDEFDALQVAQMR